MPWTPNPNEPAANFELPIIDNVERVIIRDFKGALDYYYPADDLPDFRERTVGLIRKLEFPCLAIGPRSNLLEEADDRSHIVEAARIDIYLGVTADSPDTVSRLIMKYVKVMNAVLRTARQDFFTGMSNPFEVVLDLRHEYGPLGEKDGVHFRGAIMELTVNLRER